MAEKAQNVNVSAHAAQRLLSLKFNNKTANKEEHQISKPLTEVTNNHLFITVSSDGRFKSGFVAAVNRT